MLVERHLGLRLPFVLVGLLCLLGLAGCPQESPDESAFQTSQDTQLADGQHLDSILIDAGAAIDGGTADTQVVASDAVDTLAPDSNMSDMAVLDTGVDTQSIADGCGCATDADCPAPANCQEHLCTKCVCVASAQLDGTTCGAAQTCQTGKCLVAKVWSTGLSTGNAYGCARHGTGHVSCWGTNNQLESGQPKTTKLAQSALPVQGITTAASISSRGHHTCVILADQSVRCWGDNFWGQLGVDNGGTDTAVPTKPAITGVQQIASGGQFTLALRTDGTLWGWGQNNTAQLLDGTAQSSKSPKPIGKALSGGPLKGLTHVCAGDYHACVIDSGGSMWCWGKGQEGQVGNGESGVSNVVKQPIKLANMPAMASCSAGAMHTCAVTKTGQLWCWGRNSSAQLGDKTTTMQTKPSWVSQQSSVAQVAVGIAHTCVRRQSGTVQCWGRNDRNQVSVDSVSVIKSSLSIPLGSKAVALSAGTEHTCATLDTGAVQCWGRGDQGQTGVGKAADSAVPKTVKTAP